MEVYDEHGRPITTSPAPRTKAWVATGARAGVGMGTALAIAISWSVHQSIVWAIIHGFLGWFYVGFYALTRG